MRKLTEKSKASYVAQHDIRAHMNRIFGFGNWNTRVVETKMLSQEKNAGGRWVCCWMATVEITVFDAAEGNVLSSCTYQDSAASENMAQPALGDAHHLALTTAVSTAFKRACTNLGDQFGLSLYNKGQTEAFVIGTLVHPGREAADEVQVAVVTDEAPDIDLPEADGTAPQAQEAPETTDSPAMEGLDPGTGEVGPAVLSETAQSWVNHLRTVAQIPDSAERILAVGQMKDAGATAGILGESIVVQDRVLTLARLADEVATGALLKGQKS